MFEIQLYGEIVTNAQSEKGFVDVAMLQNELQNADGKDIFLKINSVGGAIQAGFDMYNALRRYAKKNNAKITTFSEGEVASIATVPFLAGDKRIINKYVQPFVHNPLVPFIGGNGGELREVAGLLDGERDRIANFYADHTNLSFEEAKNLMENNTFINANHALEMRFATEMEEILLPENVKRFNQKQKNKMSEPKFTKEHQTLLDKFKNFLNLKPDTKNLMVYSVANDEVDFPNIENESDIKVGEKATIDGQNASGSYLMKSGETYVFENGELSEIQPKENELEAENSQLKTEIQDKDTEISNLKAQLDIAQNSADDFKAKYDAATAEMQGHVDVLNKLKNLKPDVVDDGNQDPPKPTPKNEKVSKALKNIKL